jgi:Holliday junction resolvasome RuvABC DNA-binding subunit
MGGSGKENGGPVGEGPEARKKVVSEIVLLIDKLITSLQELRRRVLGGDEAARDDAIKVLMQLQMNNKDAEKAVKGVEPEEGETAESIVRKVFEHADR